MKRRYKIAGYIFAFFAVALGALALVLSHTSACTPAPALAAADTPMNAIAYRCYGSPDVVKLEQMAKPVPGDHELLVKVHAASVNPLDWHYMRGEPYLMRMDAGIGAPKVVRLGVDFSGTVEAVGKSVTRFKPGDEIFGDKRGAFGEYLSIPDDRALVLKPDNITHEQAAAVPVAAITALQTLRDQGKVKAGQKVLINGASGGVGTFAVQIAKTLGAEVTGVCSTRNVELVRSLGADYVIDYTKEDVTRSGKQFDVIVDTVGNRDLLDMHRALKPKGIFVIVGGPEGPWLAGLIMPIKAAFIGPFLSQDFKFFLADVNQNDLGILNELLRSGKLTAVIDRRYPLSETAEALKYLEAGHARGKVVVTVP